MPGNSYIGVILYTFVVFLVINCYAAPLHCDERDFFPLKSILVVQNRTQVLYLRMKNRFVNIFIQLEY